MKREPKKIGNRVGVTTEQVEDSGLIELTDVEKNNIKVIRERLQGINTKIFNLGALELDIDKMRKQLCKLEEEADLLRKEIPTLQSEFKNDDLTVSNELIYKYGKYELTEDLKIKKVGN